MNFYRVSLTVNEHPKVCTVSAHADISMDDVAEKACSYYRGLGQHVVFVSIEKNVPTIVMELAHAPT